MRKRILIHSIVFSPDGVSTAYLYNDVAMGLLAAGFEVVVLTTTPHYNVLPEELAKQPLIPKLGGIFYESDFNGIKVIHVPQKKFKNSVLRIIGFCYWHFLSFVLGMKQKKIDLILSPSPPLTIGLINLLIGKFKKAKVVYNVQEIYPDFLINKGSLRSKPVIKFLKAIEKVVYNGSDAVTTIDPMFYQTIAPRFKNISKLRIIPNFVDTEIFRPIEDYKCMLDSSFFPENDTTLKVMYAGNIGHAQDWRPFLQVAKELREFQIEFWVIGEGVMKSYLEDEIKSNHLTNVHLIPYQNRELMPALIAYADVHFIFMAPEMEREGFPSKVYTIMACAKPLLVTSGSKTPIHNFLKPIGCAKLIQTTSFEDKCDEIAEFLKHASTDRNLLNSMGSRGYELIQDHYSKKPVISNYISLINQIISAN